MSAEKRVTVVGAGLAGSLISIMFARRGFQVDLYESGPDIRTQPRYTGKSINLAMSLRGLSALQVVGLADEVANAGILMAGRCIHDLQGNTSVQPYGKAGQGILSVDRRKLNEQLLDAAEKLPNVRLHFSQRLETVVPRTSTMRFAPKKDTDPAVSVKAAELIVGADGAYSNVRKSLLGTHLFGFHQRFLGHGYKELSMPPTASGDFAMRTGVLHIWPRGSFMMIALPNQDRSFTVTLFQAYESAEYGGWNSLKDDKEILHFMNTHFPDAVPLMPTLLEDFKANRVGPLVTATCTQYHYRNSIMLVGDAAHAIVPFYGQGMNAAFEDCKVFDELLDQYDFNDVQQRTELLEAYSKARVVNGEAIAELAQYNYIEMRHHTASRLYKLRSKLDAHLFRWFPNSWVPLYTMVTFSLLPYSEALRRKAVQDKWVKRGVVATGVVAVGSIAGALAWLHSQGKIALPWVKRA